MARARSWKLKAENYEKYNNLNIWEKYDFQVKRLKKYEKVGKYDKWDACNFSEFQGTVGTVI